MMVLLLLSLTAISTTALVLLWHIVRARNKRLLLADAHGASCDAPDVIGISVVCSGVADIAQVENLLSVEYARYEVVVVMDSLRHPNEFASLASRYHMIRVEYMPSREFPVGGVRSLGRSRKRSFRRLVLVDRASDTPEGDFDAGAGVATYDYILPLREGQYLLPDVVERLAAEIGEQSALRSGLMRTWIGEPVALYAREALVAAGGFAYRPVRSIPRRRRKTLWEPICSGAEPPCRTNRYAVAGAVAGLVAGIAVSAIFGLWPLTSVLLTVAVVWVSAEYARQALVRIAGPRSAGLVSWRRCLSKIRWRNFSMS